MPDRTTIYPRTCVVCDSELVPMDCWACGGDGLVDGYDEDPINFSPGEMVVCSVCDGTGECGMCCPFCDEDPEVG